MNVVMFMSHVLWWSCVEVVVVMSFHALTVMVKCRDVHESCVVVMSQVLL